MSKVTFICFLFSFLIYFISSEVTKRSTCSVNEMYIECTYCGPKTCEDLGHPIPCGGATGPCDPGCVCIDGFVRDANGTCISKTECPSCGGDFNATTGCGNHCRNSCSDYNDRNKTCYSGCLYVSCQLIVERKSWR
ncbi:hypothetical protein K1T71_006767 [Dendrolimus kikuchii]|uniref:Uncharacterized protein n=1 Tax=Dendrolimus kikuchii TaxID=765133 RepID=A0ACC1D2D9_9NEOP|nr:hypothetical protein K1T71_006767 [Dendrolimus kikuchii]